MKNKFLGFLVVVFSLLSGPSFAEERACDSYIAKLCTSGDDHGPGCLKGHESEVSAECKSDIARLSEKGAGDGKGISGRHHHGRPPQSPDGAASFDSASPSAGQSSSSAM